MQPVPLFVRFAEVFGVFSVIGDFTVIPSNVFNFIEFIRLLGDILSPSLDFVRS